MTISLQGSQGDILLTDLLVVFDPAGQGQKAAMRTTAFNHATIAPFNERQRKAIVEYLKLVETNDLDQDKLFFQRFLLGSIKE